MSKPEPFTWIEPPWNKVPLGKAWGWPYVGDPFLAAVRCQDRNTGKSFWEFAVITWTENYSVALPDGDEWYWDSSDIAWIARIPEPEETP